MERKYTVHAEWDDEAGVWVVDESDIPGLNVESETFEGFVEIVQEAAPFLLNLDQKSSAEIIIRSETKLLIQPRRLNA